jgi:indole-3-glycerol phosphate synthase
LAARLPAGPAVAESGLRTAADAAAAALYGYTLALVGTALMRSDDPAALIGAMRRAGQESLAA